MSNARPPESESPQKPIEDEDQPGEVLSQRLNQKGGLLLKYILIGLLIITIAVLIGIVGIRYFTGKSWVDSFYIASSILTSVGDGGLKPQGNGTKVFVSFYSILSVTLLILLITYYFTRVLNEVRGIKTQ